MTVVETTLKSFPLVARGKVRDIYNLNKNLLIVATDRISAFDVVFREPVPDKGSVLTGLSVFWFQQSAPLIPNHLITADIEQVPGLTTMERNQLKGRAMLVKKGQVVPVECVVRGYLAGSGLAEYRDSGMVAGIKLPKGLVDSSKLPEPIFTPTTKENTGHDQPLTYGELVSQLGQDLARQLREFSLELYQFAANKAEASGIIIADTKFEFAWIDGVLMVVDEIFTPDSSRFWPLDRYSPGKPQPSFDKQFVRDYLETLHWDKTPPPPPLPEAVIAKTREKYLDAYHRIVGKPLF
jgi:phosphoribosylaminoimidazole-succinocarboxamide synthase